MTAMKYFNADSGRRITCKIYNYTITDAKLFIDEGSMYICQNLKNGVKPDKANRFGYKYGWHTQSNFREGLDNITNLKFVDNETEKFDDSYDIF